MTWTTPPFISLPSSPDPRFRWAGSRLLDEEQYTVEGWQRSVDGFEVPGGTAHYWRISIEGCRGFSRLKDQRRAERKAAWQARQEADDEWSDRVASFVDGGVQW